MLGIYYRKWFVLREWCEVMINECRWFGLVDLWNKGKIKVMIICY